MAAMTATTHNPFDETHWASCLRENLTSSSYGEGLETGCGFSRGTAPVPYPTSIGDRDRYQSLMGRTPERSGGRSEFLEFAKSKGSC